MCRFFLLSWNEVILRPLGMSATIWPVVSVPDDDDDDDEGGAVGGMSVKETEVLGEKLTQCHFVHHKSHMT
jgi:hypothetical protein